MMARVVLLSLLAFLSLQACAHVQPDRTESSVPERKRAEFDRELAQLMRQDEKLFAVFAKTMDEYQDLLVMCDGIKTGKEEGGIAAECRPKLDALKQELQDLSRALKAP